MSRPALLTKEEKRERANAYSRIWRARYKEKIAIENKIKYEANREKILARKRIYQKEVVGKRPATEERKWKDRQRKAMRRAAIINGTLSYNDWLNIIAKYDGKCAYCRRADRPLEQDHVIPLSKGGAHSAENLVPACKPCNSSKGAKLNFIPRK